MKRLATGEAGRAGAAQYPLAARVACRHRSGLARGEPSPKPVLGPVCELVDKEYLPYVFGVSGAGQHLSDVAQVIAQNGPPYELGGPLRHIDNFPRDDWRSSAGDSDKPPCGKRLGLGSRADPRRSNSPAGPCINDERYA